MKTVDHPSFSTATAVAVEKSKSGINRQRRLRHLDYSVSLVECDAPLSTVSLEGQVLEATPATFSRL